MRYAIIEKGRVSNIVEAKRASDIAATGDVVKLPSGSPVVIGYVYDGSTFSPPVESDYIADDRKRRARLKLASVADPLFFQWQAGEAEKEDWLKARNDILKPYRDGE